jgi:hypothetical protein
MFAAYGGGPRSAPAGNGADSSDGRSAVSSGSASRRVLARLRRTLTVEKQPMLRSLFLLRGAGILITVLSLILGVVVCVIMVTNFSEYRGQILYVENGSKRIEAFFDLMISVERLHFFARNWIVPAPGEEAATRGYILGNISIFQDT